MLPFFFWPPVHEESLENLATPGALNCCPWVSGPVSRWGKPPLFLPCPRLHSPRLGADWEPHKGFCSLIPLAVFSASQGIFTVGLLSGNHAHTDVKRRISKNETTQNYVILKINYKGQTPHFFCDRSSSSEIKDDHHVNKSCWVYRAFLLRCIQSLKLINFSSYVNFTNHHNIFSFLGWRKKLTPNKANKLERKLFYKR